MWKRLFCVILFVGLSYPSWAAAELIDRVVAVVNDDLITLSDLNREGRAFFKKVEERASASEREKAMEIARREVLSGLIDKMIASQKAAELGISVTDQEVDEAVNDILARNRVSMQVFMQDLKGMGETEESYRHAIHTQILQSKLVNYEVRAKIVITDERIREFYEANSADKVAKPGYHVLQMGFAWKGGGRELNQKGPADLEKAKAGARQRAEKVREMVAGGLDFGEAARKYSDLPSAADGGDIGFFKEDEMAPYMKEVVLPLKTGEVSSVVETSSGYQFFKLYVFEEDVTSFAALKENIREQLYQVELEKQFEKWVRNLRDQAYIKELL